MNEFDFLHTLISYTDLDLSISLIGDRRCLVPMETPQISKREWVVSHPLEAPIAK